MYADYTYYQTEYGGKMSADDFKRFGERAEDYLGYLTGYKLDFAFPTNARAVKKVKRCFCVFADFIKKVDDYQQMAANAIGTVTRSDGTVTGKFIKSMASGSESVSYSASESFGTDVENAAKSEEGLQAELDKKAKMLIGGVPDYNGVNLLFTGAYPYSTEVVSAPPEDKTEEPQEPEESEGM